MKNGGVVSWGTEISCCVWPVLSPAYKENQYVITSIDTIELKCHLKLSTVRSMLTHSIRIVFVINQGPVSYKIEIKTPLTLARIQMDP